MPPMTLLLKQDTPLQGLTTFGVPARARWYAAITSPDQLRTVLDDPRVQGLPQLILGGGSNMLFVNDFPGLVLHMQLSGIQDLGIQAGSYRLYVQAGQNWSDLVQATVAGGRPGLENLALIPGTSGAAPVQNIGAYGVELAERLHSVRVWEAASGTVRDYTLEECQLGYRDSVFKTLTETGNGQVSHIVLGMTLDLPVQWQAVRGYAELDKELLNHGVTQAGPQEIFQAVCDLRRRKLPDPAALGNAGSFFKNPVIDRAQHTSLLNDFPSLVSYPLAGGRYKLAAGWLIEACGFKGYQREQAGVYHRQALVLVNHGGASGTQIWQLAQDIMAAVQDRFGVTLVPEVRVLVN